MYTILAVSDGTGMTAERVVRSALVQFENAHVRIVLRGEVKTVEAVRAVVREAQQEQALIVHTLVSNSLRATMLDEARRYNVDAMDLMGPLLDRLAAYLKLLPQEKPGLFFQLMEETTRRVEAVEFMLRHDDGLHADELEGAEIVLVGISRTMKTPVSVYLAYRGWFVANVPIIPRIPLPRALVMLPPTQVIALAMAPERLVELRRTRAEHLNIPEGDYISLEGVREELHYAARLIAMNRWRTVDVTGKSVEEIAGEVISLMQQP